MAEKQQELVEIEQQKEKELFFLRQNLDTKEIANLMGISARGVEVARYRLRKKFVLEY